MLYQGVKEEIPYSSDTKHLSEKIQSEINIKLYDSLHLASAAMTNVDVFFTTDDKLVKACQNISLGMEVTNPVIWFMEVEND